MTVSILGCGWYGQALGRLLAANGFIVKGSVRSFEKIAQLSGFGIEPFLVNLNDDFEHIDPLFLSCDILIVSIPPKFRTEEKDGYLSKIHMIIKSIRECGINRIIYISSTGVYSEQNREVTESDRPDPDTEQGRILLYAEELFQSDPDFKTCIVRFGGLVGPGRHPGRFFGGRSNVPNGRAPVNLIHLEDCIGISLVIIGQDVFGCIVNAVSPDHPAKADFYKTAAIQAGLPAPQFIDELTNWKIVGSTNIPRLLKYEFKMRDWKSVNFDL